MPQRRHLPADDRRGNDPLPRALARGEGQAAFYRQIAQNDQRYTDEVEPLYGRIGRPVLILWGEEDRWLPLERGVKLHSAISGSRLETIPECAHLAQEDAPEAVLGHLSEFFSRG